MSGRVGNISRSCGDGSIGRSGMTGGDDSTVRNVGDGRSGGGGSIGRNG